MHLAPPRTLFGVLLLVACSSTAAETTTTVVSTSVTADTTTTAAETTTTVVSTSVTADTTTTGAETTTTVVATSVTADTTTTAAETATKAVGNLSALTADNSSYVFDQERLHTFELTLSDEALAQIDRNPSAEEWVLGSLSFEGEIIDRVGIRYKGRLEHGSAASLTRTGRTRPATRSAPSCR